MKLILHTALLFALVFRLATGAAAATEDSANTAAAAAAPIRVTLQQYVPSDWEDKQGYMITHRAEFWKPAETAIIICDMWDKHWCLNCTARVAEMAPALNTTLVAARSCGALVVHAPSDCMGAYTNFPQRKAALAFRNTKLPVNISNAPLDSEKGHSFPIDASDGGCDCPKKCREYRAWSKQHPAITIAPEDYISDNGTEVVALLRARGVKNVVLVGVATNMCVMARPFALRVMRHAGFNTALMRDMTDLMYNPAKPPRVSHFAGLDLMVEYIETRVCPTLLSTDFTGAKSPFRFKEDTRKRVAFLVAEGEYHANQRLPEFARELTMKKDLHCDFATGLHKMSGPGRHNIENLQILSDAHLAVLYVRRRALAPDKMALVKDYFASGRPVLGLRTSCVAFDAAHTVPKSGGDVLPSGEKTGNLVQWHDLDRDVWGGNYKGHYEHRADGTDITLLPGQENHPLLKGVTAFNSLNWLYKNRPLRSPDARVLLLGWNPNRPPEPVLWTNGPNIIYTSLGHWKDWDIPSYKNLMFNCVDFLLNNSSEKTK